MPSFFPDGTGLSTMSLSNGRQEWRSHETSRVICWGASEEVVLVLVLDLFQGIPSLVGHVICGREIPPHNPPSTLRGWARAFDFVAEDKEG